MPAATLWLCFLCRFLFLRAHLARAIVDLLLVLAEQFLATFSPADFSFSRPIVLVPSSAFCLSCQADFLPHFVPLTLFSPGPLCSWNVRPSACSCQATFQPRFVPRLFLLLAHLARASTDLPPFLAKLNLPTFSGLLALRLMDVRPVAFLPWSGSTCALAGYVCSPALLVLSLLSVVLWLRFPGNSYLEYLLFVLICGPPTKTWHGNRVAFFSTRFGVHFHASFHAPCCGGVVSLLLLLHSETHLHLTAGGEQALPVLRKVSR